MATRFAVEEDSYNVDGYKLVHRAGCRHLVDPENVGEASTEVELLVALDGYASAGTLEELKCYLAPCARFAINQMSKEKIR